MASENENTSSETSQYSAKAQAFWTHPLNLGPMLKPDGYARVVGECSDVMEFYLRIQNGQIVEARFDTDGCMATVSAGSMAVALAQGKTADEAESITAQDILDGLDGLPEDHEHCARLAAATLRMALADARKLAREPWKKQYRH